MVVYWYITLITPYFPDCGEILTTTREQNSCSDLANRGRSKRPREIIAQEGAPPGGATLGIPLTRSSWLQHQRHLHLEVVPVDTCGDSVTHYFKERTMSNRFATRSAPSELQALELYTKGALRNVWSEA